MGPQLSDCTPSPSRSLHLSLSLMSKININININIDPAAAAEAAPAVCGSCQLLLQLPAKYVFVAFLANLAVFANCPSADRMRQIATRKRERGERDVNDVRTNAWLGKCMLIMPQCLPECELWPDALFTVVCLTQIASLLYRPKFNIFNSCCRIFH